MSFVLTKDNRRATAAGAHARPGSGRRVDIVIVGTSDPALAGGLSQLLSSRLTPQGARGVAHFQANNLATMVFRTAERLRPGGDMLGVLAIVDHGAPGRQSVGADTLALNERSGGMRGGASPGAVEALAPLRPFMDGETRVLLMGCQVGAERSGVALLHALSLAFPGSFRAGVPVQKVRDSLAFETSGSPVECSSGVCTMRPRPASDLILTLTSLAREAEGAGQSAADTLQERRELSTSERTRLLATVMGVGLVLFVREFSGLGGESVSRMGRLLDSMLGDQPVRVTP